MNINNLVEIMLLRATVFNVCRRLPHTNLRRFTGPAAPGVPVLTFFVPRVRYTFLSFVTFLVFDADKAVYNAHQRRCFSNLG